MTLNEYLAEHCTSSCRRDGCPHEEEWEATATLSEKIEEILDRFDLTIKSRDYLSKEESTQSLLTLFQEEMEKAKKEGAREMGVKVRHLHGIGMTLDGKHFTDSVSREAVLDLLSPKPITK